MIDELKQDATTRMGKSIESLKNELTKIRTGRAHTSLLDHVKVELYGQLMPLSQAATITVSDSRTLSITPWDKGNTKDIEKAIATSDLGLNPMSAGEVIRVPLPPLTEERRKDMIKIVRGEGEAAKVAIRNIRRDVLSDIKDLQKEKEISEDDERRAQDDVQKITDKHTGEVDKLLEIKEKDLMEI
ncbi:ribosome recycling factor [Solemya pervernicosa gill symbiont]|uniref:Ribosome-recycling factor n=2 Tax=Gammaproteobacteria incertae sedis TaxID=118884 RepID=A0A1T2L7X3_9GAMM|nr:ribosome recycling factor [Candidatus Reidiella endopervernicosa]OOZ41183.1 ribosome recycling factor [Solemya pervernicosa gill symbiont]QKQ27092.1 ribosome recycling factor [Candidatus Reidiella endopervernicosa]